MAHRNFMLPWLGRLAPLVLLALASASLPAQDHDNVTIEQLQEALARRDAVIVDLLNRVRALENGEARSAHERDAASAADQRPPASTPPASQGTPRSGETLEVDELAAQRALERGLVREGARLLAPGQIELDPSFVLARRNDMFPATLATGDAGAVGEISRTYDVHERRVDLRAGLPWAAQLEIGLPHITVDRQTETTLGGAVQSTVEQSGSGWADATVGISKLLATERGARPNMIGRLIWLTGSGDELDGPVALGGGRSGVSTRLSASWRRDPVVFLLSGGYTRYRDEPGLRPGDSLDVSLGLGMAVSPETALVLSLAQTFADELERDGLELAGTDRFVSTLDLAVSTTVGRSVVLRGYTSAGLTEESPDYRFGLSLSSRFDTR